ncbi:Hypothetical predicted protein [Cloeon dipterum]|uniref:Peptidase S1 domain-containing protein n=1 Tax=Cloeon dipterum TaxID=197152 RepID=A0A8S1BZ99_9INSE|nr:Hypothetical predicted protein [Cloeon dipterum]
MIRVIYFLALAVTVFALPNKFEIAVGDDRIANGTDAPQGKYPSQSYGNESKLLKEVDINIMSNADCQAIHYNPVYDFHICGGVTEYDKGQCGLDSGGGMFVDGMQVGIISWYIEPCGVAPYPGVSTKVSHYIDWISEHIIPRQLD